MRFFTLARIGLPLIVIDYLFFFRDSNSMTPKSEFGSRVKFFFSKFSLEMIEFILIRNPNEILRVKLSKLGFHFQNFIPYKKRPKSKIIH